MFQRILVGFDGSEGSRRALQTALTLAKGSARVMLVSVEEHIPRLPSTIDEVQDEKEADDRYFAQAHADARRIAAEQGVPIQVMTVVGHAAKALVEVAQRERADLLVMGHSGRSSVWGNFLGTTADKVIRHAPCSVLVVR